MFNSYSRGLENCFSAEVFKLPIEISAQTFVEIIPKPKTFVITRDFIDIGVWYWFPGGILTNS